MGILIAKVAVAGNPIPVPVVVKIFANRHDIRRGAGPEVEIKARRQRRGRIDEADAFAPLVADGVGHFDVADLSAPDEVDRLPHAGHAAALGPHLADAAELAGPLRDHADLFDVVAARLLDIHILAGLHRPHGHHGMPVIRSGDGDHVDVLVVEQPTEILLEPRHPGQILQLRPAFHQPGRVAIGKSDHLGIGISQPLFHVRGTSAAQADDGDTQLLVGTDRTRARGIDSRVARKTVLGGSRYCRCERLPDKVPAGEVYG